MKTELYNTIIIVALLLGVYSFFSLRDIFRTHKMIVNDFQEIAEKNQMALKNHHDKLDFCGPIRRHHRLNDVRSLATENADTEKNYLLLNHLN